MRLVGKFYQIVAVVAERIIVSRIHRAVYVMSLLCEVTKWARVGTRTAMCGTRRACLSRTSDPEGPRALAFASWACVVRLSAGMVRFRALSVVFQSRRSSGTCRSRFFVLSPPTARHALLETSRRRSIEDLENRAVENSHPQSLCLTESVISYYASRCRTLLP